jgi:nickel-dependent lactate racemase
MMKSFQIPFGTSHLALELEEKCINEVLASNAEEYEPPCSQEELVRGALEGPIHSAKLCDLAADARKILIITSDHTRPVPSRITLPIILKEIRKKNPTIDVKILIATGCHRPTSYDEMLTKFGKELVDREEIINHDSRDIDNIVYKGLLPSGGELWVNSLVDWAEVVISEGFIEPHFFAGFSGGRKSILPGIAAEKTVLANHCSKFIASSYARTGNLKNNPIHEDMMFAAKAAKLQFIMNVVINGEKNIINAFAGDPLKAHEAGCDFVRKLSSVRYHKEADIVITSNGGYPLDQNIYQAVKGMTAAEACVKNGGVIIMVAACNDGHGGEAFYKWFADAKSPSEVAERIAKIQQQDSIADQWEAQILARILCKCEVILVTDQCDREMITDMHMKQADNLEQALELAKTKVGTNAKVTIIPDGVAVIVDNIPENAK